MKPRLVVISGPSGVGKDAVIVELLRRHPDWAIASSVTTRPKRRMESMGKKYFFVTEKEFDRLIKEHTLLEWQDVHTWRYGTLKKSVDEGLAEGKMVLLNIEPKGVESIRTEHPELPLYHILVRYDTSIPIEQAVRKRFVTDPKRRALTQRELAVRIAEAKQQMKHLGRYDLVVENKEGKLQETVSQIEQALATVLG